MLRPLALAVVAALTTAPCNAAAAPAGKIFAPKDSLGADAALVEDYGRYGLYRVPAGSRAAAAVDPDADRLLFSADAFDTQREVPTAPRPFALDAASGPSLHVVQFVGPVKREWLAALSARGVVPVKYIANNGYIVWADAAAQSALASLHATAAWLQYASPLYAFLKVDPLLQKRIDAASGEEVDVTVQVYRHDGIAATRAFVESKGLVPANRQGPLGPGTVDYAWAGILKFENLRLRVRVADIPAIAERPDVTFVGEDLAPRMLDEKQGILLTGDFAPSPASVDYLQFLLDRGFSRNPSDYPIVDVTDSTINEGGTGATVVETADIKLHVDGSASQPSRVAYFRNCTAAQDDTVGATNGHGTLNAGIIAGYDGRSGAPYRDADGHRLGLGVNPFVRVGSTTIFAPGFDTSNCGNSPSGLIAANAGNGARISSNSWGTTSPPATYEQTQQIYDAGVRDADPDTAGNQSMIYVFAAANNGPGTATISSPGAAKNVITVGATEGVRPDWTDGCGVGASGANNANDIIDFSSRGPAPGNRTKPELVAPGTHIQSGASNYAGYDGTGVCDRYHPAGQTEFAASSGTSHATPAVAGVASLAYWWIAHGGGGIAAGTLEEIGGARAPSPALMKAWLIAHPTYLAGVATNDNLPSNDQGYGMPNLSAMFDATRKVLVDQSELFTATGDARTYTVAVADVTKPLRIALAYTDAPGALGSSPQVNNLDLSVAHGANVYLGNRFDHQWSVAGDAPDTRNNYEAVFLPAGTTGEVTITVAAANIADDATNSGEGPNQDFALVCSNCTQQPTFTLSTPQPAVQVCRSASTAATVRIGRIAGFADPVTLATNGGASGIVSSVAPTVLTPPGDATLTVATAASVPTGDYTLTVAATAGDVVRTVDLALGVYADAPAAAMPSAPADGATGIDLAPTFAWQAASGAYDYLVQIATDANFAHIIASHETTDTAWTVGLGDALASSTAYYWRVVARNPCGDSIPLPGDALFADGFEPRATGAQAFTTLVLPADCPVGVVPVVVFNDDLEHGVGGWTHGAANGGRDGWTLGTAAPRSGTHAWQSGAPPAGVGNDAWLVSPGVALPANLGSLNLRFWNRQSIKSAATTCQDGALLEVSTNDGGTWTQVPASKLLTDTYDHAISGAFQNPLANRQGWCGDPGAYAASIVDLAGYAGQTVRLRFRIGHDRFTHRDDPNWAIDDIVVSGCPQ